MNIVHTGVSGIWMLANISYAGMLAQNNPDRAWRIISFIFGLPGTLLSAVTIREGSMRAYGIALRPAPAPVPLTEKGDSGV